MKALLGKYKRESVSMLAELGKKAAKLHKAIALLESKGGAFTIGALNQAQEITSLAADVEKAIYICLEAEREIKAERDSNKREGGE